MTQHDRPGASSGPTSPRPGWAGLADTTRPREPRVFGGVASGLARSFDVDPVLLRVLFAVLTVFSGAGIVVYAALWLALPEDGSDESPITRHTRVSTQHGLFVVGVAAAVTAVILFFGTISWQSPQALPFLLFAGLAVAAFVFLWQREPGRAAASAPAPRTGTDATPGGPTGPGGSAVPGGPGAPAGSAGIAGPSDRTPPGVSHRTAAGGRGDVTRHERTDVLPVPGAPPPATVSVPVEPDAATPASPAGPMPPGSEAPTGEATDDPARAGRDHADEGPGARPPVGHDHDVRSAPPEPPAPRPSSPPIVSVTLALILIAWGVIWLVDEVTSRSPHPSVAPGVALVIITAGLLFSAWYGRARLLIPLGALAALLTLGSAILVDGPIGSFRYEPTRAADVRSSYTVGAGELVLDLSTVSDPEALDGRTITVDVSAGQADIYLPSSLDVWIDAEARFGELNGLASEQSTGTGSTARTVVEDDADPNITLRLDVLAGEASVYTVLCPGDTLQPGQPTMIEGGTTDAPACR